ncbi:hypothetical protein ACFY36_19310 [Actinoplanes sp. NPDC000266]
MVERIRELLDEAVGDITPAEADPVAGVVRRGRAAGRRRRAAVAGALAAVLLAGGLGAGRLMGDGPSMPVADAPYVAGGVVVAGGLELPVPDGWRVVEADAAEPCGDLTRTILLITSDRRGCQYAPVEVSRTDNRNPGGTLILKPGSVDFADGPLTSPVSVTLPGGEPVWMQNGLDSEELKPRTYEGYSYLNELLLPWSGMLVVLRMDGAAQREIIDSMRSNPGRAGVLVLPKKATSVGLTLPDDTGRVRAAGRMDSDDPKTAASVLGLLRAQTDVVDDADACAGPEQHNARLTLKGAGTTTVIISLGKRCQEAVSSEGGRVRLSDATVAALKRLFGIAAVVAK